MDARQARISLPVGFMFVPSLIGLLARVELESNSRRRIAQFRPRNRQRDAPIYPCIQPGLLAHCCSRPLKLSIAFYRNYPGRTVHAGWPPRDRFSTPGRLSPENSKLSLPTDRFCQRFYTDWLKLIFAKFRKHMSSAANAFL